MGELEQYDYNLPRHLIAQTPALRRADARLLVVDRRRHGLAHHHVRDLPTLLLPGDCLVLNDTRVIAARLVGYRTRTGGRWEGLFLEAGPRGLWRVMAKARGKLSPGETVRLINARGEDDVKLHLGARESDGTWVVRPESDESPFSLLERVGRVPLPPYIRKGEMVDSDRQRYQTVYACHPGAIAAPTAGLHLTTGLLREMERCGVHVAKLTLHVGLGTFRPIETETLAEHRMDSEWVHVSKEVVDEILACRKGGGRVVAVGTTVVRALESAARDGCLRPLVGRTDLFIRPPFAFRVVDSLLTNFHLPRTTLLVLVRTFGGDSLVMQAYREAIAQEYRFYSYGDAMLIV